MKTMTTGRTLVLAMLCALLAATVAFAPAAQASDAPSGVAVRDVRTDGSSVTGWVVNETGHTVDEVRLMVEQEFRWTREMRPGDDNPGSGTIVKVPQAIPPNGRVQFRYDMPTPLPQRTDGTFQTAVKVLSFTERWLEPTAAVKRQTIAP